MNRAAAIASGQESLFLDYVHRLDRNRAGRRLAFIHLSRLQPYNRRGHHLSAAIDIFEPMVRDLTGQLFKLGVADLAFVFRGEVRQEVIDAIDRVRFLFSDDPLMVEKAVDDGSQRFITWYNVENEYDRILDLARDCVEDAEAQVEVRGTGTEGPAGPRTREQPMTPQLLARMEDALSHSDLTNLIRRQYVCSIAANRVPERIYSELFISITDLRDTVLPGVNLTANKWLFQHLTETLDRRVLSMLSKTSENHYTGDISINLNVSTLLSEDFLLFEDSVIAAMRGRIILELQAADILSDLGAYVFARTFVNERGYRICIDGVNRGNLPLIDRDSLGADLVKLQWDSAILDLDGGERDEIGGHIERIDGIRMILCRCDDMDAIDMGRTYGIGLFQGRQVEALIAEDNRRKGLRARRRGL